MKGKGLTSGRESEGTFREAGCSCKREAEEAAVTTEFGGKKEIEINLFWTCPSEGPCMKSHKPSEKVPIKNQGQKSLAATQSGPLSLLRALYFLSVDSLALLTLCCCEIHSSFSVRQGPESLPPSCNKRIRIISILQIFSH